MAYGGMLMTGDEMVALRLRVEAEERDGITVAECVENLRMDEEFIEWYNLMDEKRRDEEHQRQVHVDFMLKDFAQGHDVEALV